MELTVQNVYGLLLRSKLLSAEEARAMFARWQDAAKDASSNLTKFMAWMVANKYLTEYQASLLARGHADGFFLGDYKILDRLGKGRMAGVYKSKHRLGQTVAVKVLPPSKAKEANLLARFQREAKLAIRLQHPNIVRSFQTGAAAGLHFLVMEYLEGETLEDVLARRKQLPPSEAVRLVYQALQGLQHIHELGLVHRDLKPANLMLVPASTAASTLHCTIKILDIGLGRMLFDDGPEQQEQDPGLTGEGVLLGTPDYMAPEQARDPRSTDIRGDIYSLGCVLFHLLTGQTPFPDTNIISQMIKHATETPQPLKDFNKEIPDGLQQILNWMMAKDPAARYATPGRAAQALEVFLAAGAAAVSCPDLDPQMKPYLNWLKTENVGGPASSTNLARTQLPQTTPLIEVPAVLNKRPSTLVPIVAPAAAPPAAGVKKIEKPGKPRDATMRRPKKNVLPPVPPEGPAAREGALIDVEMVVLPPLEEKKTGLQGLTRRDFGLFFAGVGATVAAYLFGLAMAALVKRLRGSPTEDKE